MLMNIHVRRTSFEIWDNFVVSDLAQGKNVTLVASLRLARMSEDDDRRGIFELC